MEELDIIIYFVVFAIVILTTFILILSRYPNAVRQIMVIYAGGHQPDGTAFR